MKLILALILSVTALTAEARKGGTDFSQDIVVDVKECKPVVGGSTPAEIIAMCGTPLKVVEGYKEDLLYNVPGKKAYMPWKDISYKLSNGNCITYLTGRNRLYSVERCGF